MSHRVWFGGLVALVLVAVLAAPAGATTLVRLDLEELVATNGTIVVGQVLDAVSRWNDDHSFIVTEVRLALDEVVKGRPRGEVVTLTLLGGRVGSRTTLILGGATLVPGNRYLLFLNREELPGGRVLTVRDHVQGAFEVIEDARGPRALSQALSMPLWPDARGRTEPPGGREGLALGELVDSIRRIEARLGARREVK